MAGVFDKLQLKDQKEIVVLNAPASFEPELTEDWSAVRFRRAEFIKSMKRDSEWAMTKVGKAKANARKKAPENQ